MTEAEAREWVCHLFGGDGEAKLAQIEALVRAEAASQNLIAPSTLDTMWSRHLVDSAQLILLAKDAPGLWLDIGTGAGFPGLVVAALTERKMVLVEPRKRRVEFLEQCVDALGVGGRVIVAAKKVEALEVRAGVISARAVASLDSLLGGAARCSDKNTLWVLPKGQSAREEIVTACQTWHGVFHVEHSVTDPNSLIVLAKGVSHR